MEDNYLVHCPVIHNPAPSNGNGKPSSRKESPSPPLSKSSKASTIIHKPSPYSIFGIQLNETNSVATSLHRGRNQNRESKCGHENSVVDELPVMVNVPGIVSLIGDGEDIDIEECLAFLSELDWEEQPENAGK